MRIVKVVLENWKGVSGEFHIEPLTLLCGPNGSGKTGLLGAIQWAITGQTRLGGTNDATMRLCDSRGAKVTVYLDDGFFWTREITWDAREAKASVDVFIGGRPAGGVRKADPIILEHVGDFPAMFDLSFIGASPEARRKFAVDLCSQAGTPVDADAVVVRAKAGVLRAKLGDGTVDAFTLGRFGRPSTELALEELRQANGVLSSELDNRFAAQLERSLSFVGNELRGDVSLAISAAIDKADGAMNQSRSERDRAHGAAQELSARKAELQTVAETVDELKKRRDETAKQREDLIGQQRLQEGRVHTRQTLVDRLANAQNLTGQAIKHLGDTEGKYPDRPLEEAATLEAESKALLAGLLDVPNIAPLREAWETAESSVRLQERDLQGLESSLGVINSQLAGLRVSIDNLMAGAALRLSELMLLADRKCAAHFEADEPATRAWNELKSFIEATAKQDAEMLKALGDRAVTIGTQANEKQREIDFAKSELVNRRLTAEVAKAHYDQVRDAHEASVTSRTATMNEAHTKSAAATQIRNAWAKRDSDIKADTERANATSKAAVAIEADLAKLDSDAGHVPTEELAAQLTRLTESLSKLDAEIDRKGRYAQLESELAACAANAESQQTQYEVYNLLGKSLRTIREELMFELVAPMLTHIDEFLHTQWPQLSAYCDLANDRGKAIFELGWKVKGATKVSLPALSGAQAVIFGAALSYAITKIKNPPLCVLSIEGGELNVEHETRMMLALQSILWRGNVFFATHRDIHVGGWNRVPFTSDAWTLDAVPVG